MQLRNAAFLVPIVLVALLGILVAPWAAGIALVVALTAGVGALILRAFARPTPGREHSERSQGAVDPQTYATGAPASGEGNTPPRTT